MPRCCVDVLNATPPGWGVKIDSVQVNFTFSSGRSASERSNADVGSGGHAIVCTRAQHAAECAKSATTSVTFRSNTGRRKTVSLTVHANRGQCMVTIPLQPTLARAALRPFGHVPTDDSVAKTDNPIEEVTGLLQDVISEEAEAP